MKCNCLVRLTNENQGNNLDLMGLFIGTDSLDSVSLQMNVEHELTFINFFYQVSRILVIGLVVQ